VTGTVTPSAKTQYCTPYPRRQCSRLVGQQVVAQLDADCPKQRLLLLVKGRGGVKRTTNVHVSVSFKAASPPKSRGHCWLGRSRPVSSA